MDRDAASSGSTLGFIRSVLNLADSHTQYAPKLRSQWSCWTQALHRLKEETRSKSYSDIGRPRTAVITLTKIWHYIMQSTRANHPFCYGCGALWFLALRVRLQHAMRMIWLRSCDWIWSGRKTNHRRCQNWSEHGRPTQRQTEPNRNHPQRWSPVPSNFFLPFSSALF